MDSSEVRHGRPYGGCGILWRSDLLLEVTPIATISERICPVSVKIDSCIFLLCTVYIPCGTIIPTVDTHTAVIQSLAELTSSKGYLLL